jgi:hypothetical protein
MYMFEKTVITELKTIWVSIHHLYLPKYLEKRKIRRGKNKIQRNLAIPIVLVLFSIYKISPFEVNFDANILPKVNDGFYFH